jgi:trimethylamine:corrinoid methyltransferase-like protein
MKQAITQIYSDEKMDRLYHAALRVLRGTGFFIDHDLLLNEFEKRKMRVDRTARRVFISEDIINDLLSPDPQQHRQPDYWTTLPAGFSLGGSFPKYYDSATQTTQPGRTEILTELVRVFADMPHIDSVGRIVTLCDVPQPIEPILASALVIKHCPRPGGGEVYKADNVPYLIELGEIITGRPNCTDYVASCTFDVAPLRLTRDEADMILAKARYNIPAFAGTMPSSGATAPVTREGTIVIELAEILMIWLCYRLVAPDIALGAICASSIFDMREGTCCFSAPEVIIQDCATAQICWRYFGAQACMACGYVDAKLPGVQTTYEKLFKACWSHHFLGFAPYLGGLLEAGQTFSPTQALLDMDIWASFNALFEKELPEDHQIPFADIHDVATRQGTFLETDHCLEHFREVLRPPMFFDRTARRLDDEEIDKAARLLDRIQERYNQHKRNAPEYLAPAEICRAVDKVVERAKTHLL